MSFPVIVIPLMLHTDLHLGNTWECANQETVFQKSGNIGQKRAFTLSMMSYWKSFICNKHVTKRILCDKTLDNQLSIADKSFIKLGHSQKSMIFIQQMFAISGCLFTILKVIGHL
jgi:hypothetical protein